VSPRSRNGLRALERKDAFAPRREQFQPKEDTEFSWYSPGDIARWLRCSPQHLTSRIRSGEIHAIRVGDHWRIPESEVLRIAGAKPPSKEA
jgi:excisionase family DNA binding protein